MSAGHSILVVLLIAGAFFATMVGLARITIATEGVALVALAAVLLVFARLIQAAGQHAALMAALQEREPEPETAAES